jgi:photosystem II protein PsbQ
MQRLEGLELKGLNMTGFNNIPVIRNDRTRLVLRRLAGFVLALLVASTLALTGATTEAMAARKAVTYSDTQVAAIHKYEPVLLALREKITELAPYIAAKDWSNVRTFLRRPLGELRTTAANLNYNLLPQDRNQATKELRDLMARIEVIDGGAKDQNAPVVQRAYAQALEEFDQYLKLVPQV